MTTSRTYHGHWHRPGEDAEYPGTFEIPESGDPVLTLYEPCRDHPFDTTLLVGRSIGGRPITLHHCYFSSSEGGGGGDSEVVKYKPLRAFDGLEAEDVQALKFDYAALSLSGLREWLGPPGLRYSGRHSVEYEAMEPVSIKIDEATLTIYRRPFSNSKIYEISLVEEARMELEVRSPLSIDEWQQRYFTPLSNLLMLLTGHPSQHEDVVFRVRDGPAPNDVRLVTLIERGGSQRLADKNLHPMDMRTTYPDVKSEFQVIVARWFSLYGEARAAVAPFFATERRRDVYIEQRFLGLVQALEGYHRWANSGRPGEDHEQRIERILDAVSTEDREWLRGKLAFSHEATLKERLDQLVVEAGEVVQPFIENRAGFIRRVVDSRNSLAHRHGRQENRMIPAEQMWKYCYVLALILRAHLFQYLFPDRATAGLYAGATPEYSFQKGRIKLP